MSIPVPGNYYIVNSVVGTVHPSILAVQFNGQGAALTVESLTTGEASQVWTISNYDANTQTISPRDDPSLQVAFGNNYLTTLPSNGYTWVIRESDSVISTIRDGGLTVYWDLDAAEPDEQVTYSSESGHPTEQWWLYKV